MFSRRCRGAVVRSLSPRRFATICCVFPAVSFFVLRANDTPAGCGGIQLFGTAYGEIKRMYVRPRFRGLGLGKLLLNHLADYARSRGVGLLCLETGIHQVAAISLYDRM